MIYATFVLLVSNSISLSIHAHKTRIFNYGRRKYSVDREGEIKLGKGKCKFWEEQECLFRRTKALMDATGSRN